MSTRRAILHVGTMKTGTSTLQATLSDNPEFLRACGFQYLGWPLRTSEVLAERLPQPGSADIIISDEGLWHFCGTKRSDTPAIARLLDEYRVTIVVYFRRPDQYVESWFSQGLKTGFGAPDVVTFLGSPFVNSKGFDVVEQGPAGFDSPAFLENIDLSILQKLAYFELRFPDAEVVLRPFERPQLIGGDVVEDFFDAVGLPLEQDGARLRRSDDRNVSPNADALLFVSLLRQRHGVPEDLLQRFLASSGAAGGGGSPSRLLRIEEARAINAVMRPVFRQVQATWGGGSGDDFFVDWEVADDTHRVSELRDLHDLMLASRSTGVDPLESPPPRSAPVRAS